MTHYMTQADRHFEEGQARLQDGDVCHHGRPAGFSNYDVRFCGTCEREEWEEEAAFYAEEENARIRAMAGYPAPIGPRREGAFEMEDFRVLVLGYDRRPVRTVDPSVPF